MSTTQVLISGPPMSLGRMQPNHQLEGDFGGELSAEAKRVARQQLREDENGRQQALRQLRDWVIKSEEIQGCRLGTHEHINAQYF
jgi:hypothetical protein